VGSARGFAYIPAVDNTLHANAAKRTSRVHQERIDVSKHPNIVQFRATRNRG
jgi:hypothetical protein